MNITYLSTARVPDDWGHVIQIMKMCEAFAKAGHEVELVVPRRAGARKEDPYAYVGADPVFRITKLPCIDLSATTDGKLLYWLRTLSFFISAKLYLASKKYDVLYTREPFAAVFFNRFVFEAHSVSSGMRAAFQKARAVVAITSFIKEEIAALGISPERIFVAPDAVDLAPFQHAEPKAAARKRLGLPQDKKIALYLGRLDMWKGTDALYGAAELLPEDAMLAVIGAEPAELALLREAHPRITFLAFRPYREVADNQAAADVLLLPNTAKNAMSARYTSPLKLFTYMASGIPIVASDIPSVREVLNESNAFLAAPDSAEAVVAGIREALADTDGAAKRTAKARKDVEAHTWERRAEAIVSFIGA